MKIVLIIEAAICITLIIAIATVRPRFKKLEKKYNNYRRQLNGTKESK